jgi:nucleoside-diphosphate-sugar epimerase
MRKILVTGALGQIGSELVPALRERYGPEAVVASDIRMPAPGERLAGAGPFDYIDCTHTRQIESVVRRHDIDTIFHLAALLSAVAESKPRTAWDINMGGIYRVLEVARAHGCAVFHPSSIGAFGPGTPTVGTPQDTVQRPTTMYGVTKVAGELLCDSTTASASTRGPSARPCRVAPPGGGTTDYAVDIYHQALRHRHYTCYLRPDTALDMMYMPDAIRAMIELMEADRSRLVHHNAFNVTAMSVTPSQVAESIRAHIPDFEIDYTVDPVRQAIADSWPDSLDDSAARREWGWQPRFDLDVMTADMLAHLRAQSKTAR